METQQGFARLLLRGPVLETQLSLEAAMLSPESGSLRSTATKSPCVPMGGPPSSGAIVGIFFGFVGVFFGPFIGAVIGEFMARRNMEQAGVVGIATWLGFIFGVGMKLMLAFAMVGIFIIAYVF